MILIYESIALPGLVPGGPTFRGKMWAHPRP